MNSSPKSIVLPAGMCLALFEKQSGVCVGALSDPAKVDPNETSGIASEFLKIISKSIS